MSDRLRVLSHQRWGELLEAVAVGARCGVRQQALHRAAQCIDALHAPDGLQSESVPLADLAMLARELGAALGLQSARHKAPRSRMSRQESARLAAQVRRDRAELRDLVLLSVHARKYRGTGTTKAKAAELLQAEGAGLSAKEIERLLSHHFPGDLWSLPPPADPFDEPAFTLGRVRRRGAISRN